MTFGSATGSPAPADSPAVAGSPASADPAATSGLIGSVWQLNAVTEKVPAFQGVIPDGEQANYTITFHADGSFQAQADCNAVSGTYTTADPTADSGDLSIFLGPSTLVPCAPRARSPTCSPSASAARRAMRSRTTSSR